MILQTVLFIITILLGTDSENIFDDLKLGWNMQYPCEATKKITYYSEAAESNEEEFSFFMLIEEYLEKDSIINITFVVPVALNKSDLATVFYFSRHDKLNVHLLSSQKKLSLRLKTSNGKIPEIESLLINNSERCKKNTEKIVPLSGLNNKFYLETKAQLEPEDLNCGVRKVEHVQLISHGLDTKVGDWPWHVAIYRSQNAYLNYTCGGTLISKNSVLTAAHCATEEASALIPKILTVVLGKYNLFGGGEEIQMKQVSEIIVHPKYNHHIVGNDIALLRLVSAVVFNDYVQPACLWKPEFSKYFLTSSEILGTVVGWGLDHTDTLSSELMKANLPRVSDLKCIKSNALFFSKVLNGNNFCAGWRNGTSVCNGDSGGGFFVNITTSDAIRRWYVQGITSLAVSQDNAICDPSHYAVFTDVGKFVTWIRKYL